MKSAIEISIGTFRPGETALHKIDPRAKILAFSSVLMGIVLADGWLGLLPVTILSLAAGLSSGNMTRVLTDVRGFSFFYLFTILIHLIFNHNGKILLEFYKFQVTTGGINAGFFFSLKIGLIAVLGGLVSRTTHPAEMSKAIVSMLPSRGRLAQVLGRPGVVVGLALRMLPIILIEAERIRTAQIARGLKVSGKAIPKIRNLLALIGPLLTATLHRGDAIHAAMVSRGFILDGVRTVYKPLRMDFTDLTILAAGMAVAILSVVL